jgi:hypothetical protein
MRELSPAIQTLDAQVLIKEVEGGDAAWLKR